MFKGSIPALVTPFKNGELDLETLKKLVEWHIGEGSNGFVPVGTTGESPTLTHAEHDAVVDTVVRAVAGRVPVIAGAGSNNTLESIRLAQAAEKVGANGILVVTPYYNKPTQRGLIAHFTAVHDCCNLPIIIYNIPGRSVVDMSPATMGELAKLPRIVGGKGCHRRSRARPATAYHLRHRFHPAVWGRRHRAGLQRAWRARLHLGYRQCRASALRRISGSHARGRLCQGARISGSAYATTHRYIP